MVHKLWRIDLELTPRESKGLKQPSRRPKVDLQNQLGHNFGFEHREYPQIHFEHSGQGFRVQV